MTGRSSRPPPIPGGAAVRTPAQRIFPLHPRAVGASLGRRLFLALLATVVPAAGEGGLADSYEALPRVEVRLIADGETAQFRLPHRLLLSGSETVLLDGAPLEPLVDYRADCAAGVLELTTGPPPAGSVLSVSYRYLPFEEEGPPAEPDSINLFERRGDYVGVGDSVKISGSKGVGLRLESGRQVGIVQSLDCLLYTSPSPRDRTRSRMPSSA